MAVADFTGDNSVLEPNIPQQILLIDDSQSIHALVRCLFGGSFITFHSAYDGQAGITLARLLRPDLILLDIEMPGIDGFETCRRLKADSATANIPILFLTGRAGREEQALGLNLGANDYVVKPFNVTDLGSRIGASLRTAHLIRSLEKGQITDAVTGLATPVMFGERFIAEVALRVRSGNSLACIIADIDHFRHINDKYGPPTGDYVINTIAATLNDISRISDIACRRHDDVFAILLPQTSAKQAAFSAERMRDTVSTLDISHEGHSIAVTCSFGVAEAAGTYDRLMLVRADQALSHSKEKGGNCVSLAPPHSMPKNVAA